MTASRRKDGPDEAPGNGQQADGAEGWESLAEDGAGSLAPTPELEEAMREAAEAVEGRRTRPEEAGAAAPPSGEGAAGHRSDELETLRDHYVRLQADFENFRRRALREREEAHQFGHQNLVKDLLATVDNLERAIEHARQSDSADLEGLLRGVELVERELLVALEKHGLTVISAEGEPFDPALHEAMAQVEEESKPEGTVVQVFQRGYQLRQRLLRPARVLVSKRSAETPPAEAGAPDPGSDGGPDSPKQS